MQALLSHPRLMDCRRLFLSNYEIYINIGVHDFEKRGEQRVLINVDLFVPLIENTPTHDSLEEVVDYDFMRQSIVERVSKGHIHLQETLCDDVAKIMGGSKAVCPLKKMMHGECKHCAKYETCTHEAKI